MAHAVPTPQSSLNQGDLQQETFTPHRLWEEHSDVAQGEIPTSQSFFRQPIALGAVIAAFVLILFAILSVRLGWLGSNTATSPHAAASQAATQPAIPLSAADLKEMQTRDDFAGNLSKALHLRLPAYKNVTIYADNWTGNRPPAHAPITDIKARTGDNLMLVFWSPDPGTAKGLSDFVKSRAAQDGVNTGFAEFQFIDPHTYCVSVVVPVKGPGAVTCGIR